MSAGSSNRVVKGPRHQQLLRKRKRSLEALGCEIGDVPQHELKRAIQSHEKRLGVFWQEHPGAGAVGRHLPLADK